MNNIPKRIIDTSKEDIIELNNSSEITKIINNGFACLSYVWNKKGEELESEKNKYYTPNVKRNLKWAIQYSKHIGIKYLWIDALCIKQDNEEEKNQDITNMHLYYTTCDVVVIWTAIKKFDPKFQYDYKKAFNQFLDDDWINRSWTIQEGVLGKRLVVATDWGLLFPDSWSLKYFESIININNPGYPGLKTLIECRKKKEMNASEVMKLANGRNTSLVNDRVFSLFAILPYTRDLLVNHNMDEKIIEQNYMNATFKAGDISLLSGFLNENKNDLWNILNCTYPPYVKTVISDIRRNVYVTKDGINIYAKIIECIPYEEEYKKDINWSKEFPELSKILNECDIVKYGFFGILDPYTSVTISKIFTDKNNIKIACQNLKLLILNINYDEKEYKKIPGFMFFDKKYEKDFNNIKILLPELTSNGYEIGIVVKESIKNKDICNRIGIVFMNQRIALFTSEKDLSRKIIKLNYNEINEVKSLEI